MRVLMISPELPTKANPGSMAPAARQFESLEALGIEVQRFDMQGPRVLKYGTAIPKLRQLMNDVDLVHAHFGYCGWLGLTARKLQSATPPMVMSFMGDDLLGTPYNNRGDLEWGSRLAVKINKFVSKRFDQVIVKSQEMANVLSPLRCNVVPNGVDLERFKPLSRQVARRELGIEQGRMVALFPGNPGNPRKGFDLAQAAVDLLHEKYGIDIEMKTLWGVSPDEVPWLMNASNFMFMTSFVEGSPNVVKEAMACDLPIVAVHVGDVAELLEGVDGCHVCDRDPVHLAEAARELLLCPGRNSGRSLGRRRICELGLDIETVARRVLAIYEQALSQVAGSSKSSNTRVRVNTSGHTESVEV